VVCGYGIMVTDKFGRRLRGRGVGGGGGGGGEIQLKLPGPGGPEGSLGPAFVAYVFVFPGSIVDCTN